jgi:multidrug resistance efflux pump
MWGRRRRRDTETDLKAAQDSLKQAKADREDQQRKREQEQEQVIARLDRLAADNHLAQLVIRAFTEGRK